MQVAICWDVGGERINVVVNQQQELGCSQQSLGIESRASAFQRLSRKVRSKRFLERLKTINPSLNRKDHG